MNWGKAAFTRLDLLAVVVVLGAFFVLGLPAGARTKSAADVATCLDHNRELAAAWANFAVDNNDSFATTMSTPFTGVDMQPWAVGYVNWDTMADNTNGTYLTDPKNSVLANYLGRRREAFKCPADVFLSAAQRSRGWTERIRSVAGNAMLGFGADGAWNSNPEDPYVRARRFGDLIRPSPDLTFVFLEEHPDSLNDCAYFGPGGGTNSLTWYDYPASYHDGAAMFSFVDGRSELHGWRGVARKLSVRYFFPNTPNEAGQPDQRWVYERIPRRPIQ